MHSFLYSPVVKAKANDLLAITDTRASTLHLVRPIVEPIVLIENAHATTNVLRDSDLVARLLPNNPFYFDPLNFESPARAIQAFELLVQRKSCFTPLVQLNHSIPLPELRRVLSLAESTYAIRIHRDDLYSADDSWDEIVRQCIVLDVDPAELTVILDFQRIHPETSKHLQDLCLDFLLAAPTKFRDVTFIVLGGSALATVGDVPKHGEKSYWRSELELWAGLTFELDGSSSVGFADYGIISPEFHMFGGGSNANAKIRYTNGPYISYFRGEGLYKPNRFSQYHELAMRVCNSSIYMGARYSEGDKRIYDCAHGSGGTGNLATWVRADTNHHIEHVASQVVAIQRQVAGLRRLSEVKEALVSL